MVPIVLQVPGPASPPCDFAVQVAQGPPPPHLEEGVQGLQLNLTSGWGEGCHLQGMLIALARSVWTTKLRFRSSWHPPLGSALQDQSLTVHVCGYFQSVSLDFQLYSPRFIQGLEKVLGSSDMNENPYSLTGSV